MKAIMGIVSGYLAGLGLPGSLGLWEELGLVVHSATSQFWSKTGQLTSTHWLSNAEVISLVFSEVCPTPYLEIQWQNTPLQPVFLFIFKAPYPTICFISLSRHFRGPFSHPWWCYFHSIFCSQRIYLTFYIWVAFSQFSLLMTNISTFYIKSTKHFYWHHPFNELTFFSSAPI